MYKEGPLPSTQKEIEMKVVIRSVEGKDLSELLGYPREVSLTSAFEQLRHDAKKAGLVVTRNHFLGLPDYYSGKVLDKDGELLAEWSVE